MPDALHPPPSVIASWPAPNYVDPVTRGNALNVVAIFLTALSTCVVAARIWARFALIRKPGLDDALIVVSLAFATAFSITIIIVSTRYGDDRHVYDVPLSSRELSRLFTWLAEWFFILSTSLTKISILLFYRRLSSGSYSMKFIWATRIGIWFNICCAASFMLLLLLECQPMNVRNGNQIEKADNDESEQAYWKAYGPNYQGTYTCGREEISLPISGLFSVISDFYAMLLPFLLLRKLQLPMPQKMALYGVFSLGAVVVVSGILRTVFLYRALNTTYDLTWHVWITWIWSAVETYVAIICACAPALKPFFVTFISSPSAQAYARSEVTRNISSQDYINLSSRRDNLPICGKGTEFQMRVIRAEYTSNPVDEKEGDVHNDSPLDIRVRTHRNVEYDQAV